MGLEQKLSLRLSQRLVMTPTLQQAIKLLQMTRLELQDVVNQELVSNPVLDEEDAAPGSTPDEEPGEAETREIELASSAEAPEAALDAAVADDREFAAAATDADARAESAEALPTPTSDAPAPEPVVDASTTDEPFSDLDLEAYFGDYMEGTATAPRMSEEAEEFSLENRPEAPPGLEPHLTEQLGVSDAPPERARGLRLPDRERRSGRLPARHARGGRRRPFPARWRRRRRRSRSSSPSTRWASAGATCRRSSSCRRGPRTSRRRSSWSS